MKTYQEELLGLYTMSNQSQGNEVKQIIRNLKSAIEEKVKAGQYQFDLPLSFYVWENTAAVEVLSRLVYCTWVDHESIIVNIKREPQWD